MPASFLPLVMGEHLVYRDGDAHLRGSLSDHGRIRSVEGDLARILLRVRPVARRPA